MHKQYIQLKESCYSEAGIISLMSVTVSVDKGLLYLNTVMMVARQLSNCTSTLLCCQALTSALSLIHNDVWCPLHANSASTN